MESIFISPDDRNALESGNPIRVLVDEIPCVVVREDVFDAASQSEDDVRSTYPLILRAWDSEDENPDQYLEYLEHLKK